MKMEQTERSETSAYKIQTPGNYPEENIQHTEHGESLKSRIALTSFCLEFKARSIVKTSLLLYDCHFFHDSFEFNFTVRLALFVVVLPGKGKVHPCTGTEALYRPYGTSRG